jgi:hypothetical protein
MACYRRILGAAVLAATTAACGLVPALASAAPGGPGGPPGGPGGPPGGPGGPPPGGPAGNTLYVSQSAVTAAATPTGPAKNGCANAQYSTVQSAVDAAHPGQTVYLCGTTPYQEAVLVQKDLKLTGDPGAVIQASPTNPSPTTTFFSSQGLKDPESVLTVIGNANVQVQGLTIEGPFAVNGCDAGGGMFGVLQIDGGHLRLNNDQVLNIEAANQSVLGGCQYGVAIQAGRRYWPNTTGGDNTVDFVGNAEIMNTTVNTYQKNGITVDGPGSQAHVHHSTIDGGGPTPIIARNGIQISRGATGEVDHSSINNNEYSGTAPAASTGVLVFGGCGDPLDLNVQVHDNSLTNDDNAISIGNYDPSCSTAPSTPTNNQVHDNTVVKNDGETNHGPFSDEAGNSYTGYQSGISDTGNNDDIHNNTITGTVVGGMDTAFGPQTAPGGPFLVPIDIQTNPPINTKVHNNTFDGQPTNPPY